MAGHKKGRRSLGFSHHTHDFFPKKVFFKGEGEADRGKRSGGGGVKGERERERERERGG